MAWYSAGTVTATNNSTTITGSGTAFLSNVRVGDALTIAGSTSLHEVTAIASGTQLTFQPPYTGTTGSGKAYRIAPIMGYDKDLSDAFNSIRLQWGTQLSSLQPWATAATADIALSNLGGSNTGTAVFKGSPAAGRTALGLGNAATAALTIGNTDATVGRVLKVGDYGFGSGAILCTDCNSVRVSGNYYLSGITANAPLASVIYGTMIVIATDLSSVTQIVTVYTEGEPQPYIRNIVAHVAYPWRKLYTENTILGTVSQSGGIPTGAIIESGSNANGSYVKYADGTQICTNNYFAIPGRTISNGSLFRTVDLTWTFPANFSTNPVCGGKPVIGESSANGWYGLGAIADISPTTTFFAIHSATYTTGGGTAVLFAIGRWY